MYKSLLDYNKLILETVWDASWDRKMAADNAYQYKQNPDLGETVFDKEGYLNWKFGEGDREWLLRQGVISTSTKRLDCGGGFTQAHVYKDDDSNLPIWTLSIGSEATYGFAKDYTTEAEALSNWDRLVAKGDLCKRDLPGSYLTMYSERRPDFKQEFVSKRSPAIHYPDWKNERGQEPHPTDHLYYMLPTTDEWYGTHEGAYVEACLRKHNSNLDLWSIWLGGTDDYSVTVDISGEEEARTLWRKLLNATNVTRDLVPNNYFSN